MSHLVSVLQILVRLSFWVTALCMTWLAGSWIAHRLRPMALRVRFRDFVHLGRLRVALTIAAASLLLWAGYFWPGAGLSAGSQLEEVTVEVSTGGWDLYAQVNGVTAQSPLTVLLTQEETDYLEEILRSHRRSRSLYGRRRYELGAVTIRGTLVEGDERVPFLLVSTEDQAYWSRGEEGFQYNLLGRGRLADELVNFSNNLDENAKS